jgi:hypothetical protein
MPRFLTALQFFGGAGYVILMVDHRIITISRIWFHSAGRFSSLEGLSHSYWRKKLPPESWEISFMFFAERKAMKLVAGGGIEPPTRGFSD